MHSGAAIPSADLTPRRAALVAGLAYLLTGTAPYAESIFSRLLVHGNLEQTAQNTIAHPGLIDAAVVCYLVNLIGDVVIAWGLFYLLAPVSRALSLLMSGFQLMYAGLVFAATLNLITVARILHTPAYVAAFGPAALHAQIDLLLHSFRYGFAFSLILFGVHLGLLGYLIVRSWYIPWFVGVPVMVAGAGYALDGVSDYLFADVHMGWLTIPFGGELVLVLWLWIWGWRLPEAGSRLDAVPR